MAKHPEDPKKYQGIISQDEGEGEGSKGKGGKSGEIGFRVKTEISRDDLLSPTELNRLRAAENGFNKAQVDKQKLLRKERAALKEGRKDLVAQYRGQLGHGGGGSTSRYKQHPIANKAQFSGIDKQVSQIPSESEANTNDQLRNDLENRYNLTYQHQPKRTFNPRPRGPYG